MATRNLLFRIFVTGIVIILFSQNILAQPHVAINDAIFKIYNADFENVPSVISKIRKDNPTMASYLDVDFRWWKMITNNSASNESDFLECLNSFRNNNSTVEEDFERLTYFVYQIRYENFKKQSFSRYLSALKFHIFLGNVDDKRAGKLSSLEKSIFQMTIEFDKYIKYKYLTDYGISSKKNIQQYKICLQNIENMQNDQFISFETIKTYLLGKIYFEIENDYQKAYEKFGKLSADYPDNAIFKAIRRDCKVQLVANSK